MSSLAWRRKLDEARELAARATKLEFNRDYSTAFQCYVRAGDLFLLLVGEGSEPKTRARLRTEAQKVLSRAEAIKQFRADVQPVERQMLSDQEQARAVESGSHIDAVRLPDWLHVSSQPGTSDLTRRLPALSPRQIEHNARYLKRADLPRWAAGALYDLQRPLRGRHIVQRVVTDCSFVAALEVAAEHDARWGSNVSAVREGCVEEPLTRIGDGQLAHAPLYPKGEHGYPVWSPSSTYSVRLRYNGKERCISVDDSIPCYPDSTPMCAVGIEGKEVQVWPSLLEKAYMSLRGGYDFGGSNSSIDLHALTGWIPEQIGFQHAGFQREKTWERLIRNYDKGLLMVTAGTTRGMEKRRLSGQASLIDSHNYAVLDIQEEHGERWLTLMNPWERGAEREVLRMTWNEACARLDSLYLNWSPSTFDRALTWHGTWRQATVQTSSVQLVVKGTGDVWLHLARHTTSSRAAATEWIALHVFGAHDERSHHRSGLYVDGTHTLVRTQVKPGTRRITAARQGGSGDATFTLSVYANCDVELQDMPATVLPHLISLQGLWSMRTAGGNATHSTFVHNPQYVLTVSSQANIAIAVETSKDIAIQVAMVWSRGKRVSLVTQGDIVTSSGTYNYSLAMAEARAVKPGKYTLVVSTFDRGLLGDFEVRVQSDVPVQVAPIPAEGAGMFHQRIRGAWEGQSAQGGPKHPDYFSNPSYTLKVDQNSTFILRLVVTDASSTQLRPRINVALFSKASKREVVSSGLYSDPVCGVAIEETRLDPGEYLVVVSTYEPGVLATFTLDMYSDKRITLEKVADR